MFRWNNGCLEQNVIDALPDDRLEALLTDPVEVRTGQRLRTLADRLGTGDEKGFATIKTKAGADLKATIIAATLGKVPLPSPVEKFPAYAASITSSRCALVRLGRERQLSRRVSPTRLADTPASPS